MRTKGWRAQDTKIECVRNILDLQYLAGYFTTDVSQGQLRVVRIFPGNLSRSRRTVSGGFLFSDRNLDSLEPGPSRARYFPRDMLLLTTTARERAWRLLKIHSQFFDYVFLELSRRFCICMETRVTVHTQSQTNRNLHLCPGLVLLLELESSNVLGHLLTMRHRKAFGAHVSENLHRDQVIAVCAPFERYLSLSTRIPGRSWV